MSEKLYAGNQSWNKWDRFSMGSRRFCELFALNETDYFKILHKTPWYFYPLDIWNSDFYFLFFYNPIFEFRN